MQSAIERTLSQVGHMQREMDGLRRTCASLERTVQVLKKGQKWEYAAPSVPTSHWTERGFDAGYAARMKSFLGKMKEATEELRSGTLDRSEGYILLDHETWGVHRNANGVLQLDVDGEEGPMLLHDDVLLPHWHELADAIQLYHPAGSLKTFSLSNIELPPEVLRILSPMLHLSEFKTLELWGTSFVNGGDGVAFAIRCIKNIPSMQEFLWVNIPLGSMRDANSLLAAINDHPSINHVSLESTCGPNLNGYDILCSLVGGDKCFRGINLGSNGIRTMGATHIPDFLATNPPLEELSLSNNNLNDSDAALIAEALKHNNTLKELSLGGNDITDVGLNTLRKVIFDTASLDSVTKSNHTCYVSTLDDLEIGDCPHNNGYFDRQEPEKNLLVKLYSLLSLRISDIVHLLDLEFGDGGLKLVPHVLDRTHQCSRIGYKKLLSWEANTDIGVTPLSIVYGILRSWIMPLLCEKKRQTGRSAPSKL